MGLSAYSMTWYDEDVDFQNFIRLIIMRTQKPVGVTAAGFYHISLQSYYDVRIYLRDFECSSKIDSIFRC